MMTDKKTATIRYRLAKRMITPAGWEHEPAVPDWEAHWEVVETGQKGTFLLRDRDAKWLRDGLSEEEALREADKTMAVAPFLIMPETKGKVIIERFPS
jgi:hypothetical protein